MKYLATLLCLSALFLLACQSSGPVTGDGPEPTQDAVESGLLDNNPNDKDETNGDGSNLESRLEIVYKDLHTKGSGDYILENFDLKEIHVWEGLEEYRNTKIFPFYHYYSEEADMTFVVCEKDLSVAYCEGYKDDTLSQSDSGECTFTPAYSSFLPG